MEKFVLVLIIAFALMFFAGLIVAFWSRGSTDALPNSRETDYDLPMQQGSKHGVQVASPRKQELHGDFIDDKDIGR